MLISLWMLTQLVLLALSVVLGSQLPQSPAQALLLIALSALALAPCVPALAKVLTRALSLAPHAPPRRSRARALRTFRMPGDPGMPGSALARAPSHVVHASA